MLLGVLLLPGVRDVMGVEGTVDLCFENNVQALLCLARVGGVHFDDIVLCPDYVVFGSLADMDPRARKAELARFSIERDDEFEKRCAAFREALSHTERVRLWHMGLPNEILGQWYAASLMPEQSQLTIVDTHEAGAMDSWGQIYPARVAEAMRHERRVDISEARKTWARLVDEDGDLRVLENGKPVSLPADAFDHVVQGALDQHGAQDLEKLGYDLYESCRNKWGYIIAPDFFTGRARLLLSRAR